MTTKLALSALVLAPLLALVANPDAPHAREAGSLLEGFSFAELAEPIPGGCRITVKAKNGGSSGDIWLMSEESRVRSKIQIIGKGLVWGAWKKPLPMSNRRIRPGELVTMTMDLTFNCNSYRQYEFMLKKGYDSLYRCYGSDSGTTRRDIPLSDVNRLFVYDRTDLGC